MVNEHLIYALYFDGADLSADPWLIEQVRIHGEVAHRPSLYIGITKNFENRMRAHRRTWKVPFESKIVASGLTKEKALRGEWLLVADLSIEGHLLRNRDNFSLRYLEMLPLFVLQDIRKGMTADEIARQLPLLHSTVVEYVGWLAFKYVEWLTDPHPIEYEEFRSNISMRWKAA